MADLDTLRPEVREAWRRMRYASELTKGTVMSSTADMELIFRDHLRLAGSLTARQTIDAISRAERAEAELAALKVRIGASRLIEPGIQFSVPGYVGKRVRLVVEE